MKFLYSICVALLAAAGAAPAHAALNVLACEPEWAALAKELAGEQARIFSATTAMQDPHRIEARPALLAQARRADLLVCTGAELEIGWLPLLQREAGNARIQDGQPGYFEASSFVAMLERPVSVDRSMGDLHAAGNPHVHLNPHNLVRIATALSKRMAELEPASAGAFAGRLGAFVSRFEAAIARWEREAADLRGVRVVVHHKGLSYLCDWLGLEVVADLEPKPGIDPSAAYLGQVLKQLKSQPAAMVLRASYQSPRAAEWIAGQTGIKAVVLPYTVGGSEAAQDLFTLFDDTLSRLKKSGG